MYARVGWELRDRLLASDKTPTPVRVGPPVGVPRAASS
jgi:hypothetical protein